jgi:hypothetical protein
MPALTADLRQENDGLDVKALLRSLGFASFGAFMEQVPDISFERRPGSDFLAAPAGSSKLTKAFARPYIRIRRDFWRAFIEFPKPGTIRVYDGRDDKVLYLPAESPVEGPRISPVPESVQLAWRRQFVESELETLKGVSVPMLRDAGRDAFNEFARFIRENPQISGAWNKYHQSLLSDWIMKWSADNGITFSSLETAVDSVLNTNSLPSSKRVELYNLLDQIPIDELMDLRVPLRWLLVPAREH